MYQEKIRELRTEHAERTELSGRLLAKYPTIDSTWNEEDRKSFDQHCARMLVINGELADLEKKEEQVILVKRAQDFYAGNRDKAKADDEVRAIMPDEADKDHQRAFAA